MPRSAASRGPRMWASCPLNRTAPESYGWMPAMHLTRVDLPAPLSPTSAVTSPARTSKSTSWRTWTGPKLLFRPLISRMGSLMDGLSPGWGPGRDAPSGCASRPGCSWGTTGGSGDAERAALGGEFATADLGRLPVGLGHDA